MLSDFGKLKISERRESADKVLPKAGVTCFYKG